MTDEDSVVREQREANERLVLYSLRATEEAERAERARVLAERDRARLFEHAGWGVALATEDLRITSVNPALARMHGYDPAELHGARLETLCPVHERTKLVAELERLRATGHHAWDGAHVRKDGSEFPCHTEATAAPARDGEPAGIAFNFEDVSERVALRARLAIGERLTALGTLSAGVAHEINNPLTYVLANLAHVSEALPGLVADARQSSPLDEAAAQALGKQVLELQESLKSAEEGGQRIARIVAAMRVFGQPSSEGCRAAQLSGVLDAALQIVRHQTTQRATVLEHLGSAPPVRCDAGELALVFVTLLSNAAQALSGPPEDNRIRVELRTDVDGGALVEISDTGRGIAPDELSRIFDPFYTTRAVGDGSGLSLSVAHSVVTAHGGELTVESRVGEGTTFRVRLPAAAAPTRELAPAPGNAAPLQRANVLVIDDDPLVGRALRRMLEKVHDVVVVQSAKAAITLLEAGSAFDAIACDLMMPEMSGMDFYAWVLRAHPALAERVLFVTGGAASDSARAFISGVVERVVHKPFDRARIDAVLAPILRRAPR